AGSNILLAGWAMSKRFLGGVLSVFLALFASNFHPFLAWYHSTPNYFFFNSGRFIEQVINEYPLYSFILGDLHAHMLSLILTTTVVVLALALMSETKENKWLVASMGFLVGLMFSTNAFDIINYGIFCGVILVLYWFRKNFSMSEMLRTCVMFCIPFALPVIVFNMNFISPSGGLGFSFMKTPWAHVFMQFGVFITLYLLAFVIAMKVFRVEYTKWFKNFKWSQSWPELVRLIHTSSPEKIVLLGVIISGLCLALLPQFVFLKDIYFIQNPPFYRANTVFKIWYEAWILLALGAGVLGIMFFGWLSQVYKAFGKVLGVILLIIPIIISLFGFRIGYITLEDNLANTLDGLDYIQHQAGPQDYEIIKWARENIIGQPIVLEAAGQSYTNYNWFSAFTGLPTIVGWLSHEWGWRYDQNSWPVIAGKSGKVEIFYKTQNPEVVRGMAEEFQIGYVLVSENEKTSYRVENKTMESAFGKPIFDNGKSALYKTSFNAKN
ncbi:MAG: DUF2298 domain-containing protein, partial [Minisyncoccia bacterium]